MRHAFLFTLMFAVAGLAGPAVARADESAGGGSGGRRRHGNPSPAAMLRIEIRRAQAELNRAIAEARRAFVASTEFVTAVDEMRRAGRDYRAARDAALAGLRHSSDFASAKLEVEHLQRELDALRGASAPLAQVLELSRVILERRGALSRVEADVLKGDGAFADARYAWIDAGAAVAALWRDFDDVVRHDPACVAARQKIASARERLASLSG
jgi:hypothetical protein